MKRNRGGIAGGELQGVPLAALVPLPEPDSPLASTHQVEPSVAVVINAGVEGEWAITRETGSGASELVGLVHRVGGRFEVTVMGDPLQMRTVDSAALAVRLLGIDGVLLQHLRAVRD